ncbi:hypothetical protein O181_004203 [Austropuccinia psidii MF-1]|uniref:NAD-dependent epimerase/dehydratase domain-containing protein n=1 Tax=Austropuccinia psidii MF-1 TaxID=1389203 RepID=A0A9Q3BG51_9BASI|nr:hypothetical protein [Austropuccinia psidii MF-1]
MLLKEREITQKSPKLEFEVKRTRKLVHNILRVRGQVPYSPEINILDRHPEFSALKSGYNEEALTKHWPLILVTGGCGYIGSHVVLELLKQAEFGVVVVDSLSNSCLESLHRVSYIASQTVANLPPIYFHQTDIRDEARLCQIFGCYVQLDGACTIQHVIHFAALKSVNASRLDPLEYYSTNVTGTAVLLKTMKNFRVQSLVFSSSAVVYGSQAGSGKEGEINRLSETCCKILSGQPASERAINYGRVTNPYGQTKLKCEELIHEISQSNIKSFNLRSIILRYTNPSGNDPSGLIGDSPVQAENLMPIASQVLQGRREYISIYGTNYPTRDGTGLFPNFYLSHPLARPWFGFHVLFHILTVNVSCSA